MTTHEAGVALGEAMDERSMFERVHLGSVKKLARRNEHGEYVVPSINDAWAGWQSARSAGVMVGPTDDALLELAREECADFRWPSTALSIMRKAIAASRGVALGVKPEEKRQCDHPLGTTRWCPDCALREARGNRRVQMKCLHCGKSPGEHGITLLRQNAKGQPGIWACESCNRQPVPDDLAQTVAEIQHGIVRCQLGGTCCRAPGVKEGGNV